MNQEVGFNPPLFSYDLTLDNVSKIIFECTISVAGTLAKSNHGDMKYHFQLRCQGSGSISLTENLHLTYGSLTAPLPVMRRKCKVQTSQKKR